MSNTKSEKYWQILINIDNNKISIFFPGDYLKSRFGNEDVSFFVLKSKHLNDYNVAITYLNEEHGLEKVDYKCIILIFFVMMNTLIIIKKIIVISMLDFLTMLKKIV